MHQFETNKYNESKFIGCSLVQFEFKKVIFERGNGRMFKA